MRSANIKNASQDEQQNQETLITYKPLCHYLKKLINKVKLASDKTETKQTKRH